MLTIRPAVGPDVAALEAVVAEAFGVYRVRMDRDPAPMAADYRTLVNAGRVWVAIQGGATEGVIEDGVIEDGVIEDGVTADGAVVGLIVLVPEVDHLYLETIAVRPVAQGTGVGRRLLELAETEADRLGLRTLVLCTNEVMTENLAYYPRRGYRRTHRIEQDGFHRVFFRKHLAVEQTAVDQSTVDQSTGDQSTGDQSTVDQSTIDQPAVDQQRH
jgi:ribosomal protein S18 acetylase RimI-like enzyme